MLLLLKVFIAMVSASLFCILVRVQTIWISSDCFYNNLNFPDCFWIIWIFQIIWFDKNSHSYFSLSISFKLFWLNLPFFTLYSNPLFCRNVAKFQIVLTTDMENHSRGQRQKQLKVLEHHQFENSCRKLNSRFSQLANSKTYHQTY